MASLRPHYQRDGRGCFGTSVGGIFSQVASLSRRMSGLISGVAHKCPCSPVAPVLWAVFVRIPKSESSSASGQNLQRWMIVIHRLRPLSLRTEGRGRQNPAPRSHARSTPRREERSDNRQIESSPIGSPTSLDCVSVHKTGWAVASQVELHVATQSSDAGECVSNGLKLMEHGIGKRAAMFPGGRGRRT